MKAYWGSGDVALQAFLTSALDGGEWSASGPGHFNPRERASDTHWIRGCVSPRACLDAVVKRKIPSIIQPVAQRFTTELSRFLINSVDVMTEA
jgi:hypothetical protein